MPALPIIDISPLLSKSPDDWRDTARQIDEACRLSGFFYITGHDIAASDMDAVWAQTEAFFALPMAEKLKIDIRKSPNHRGYSPLAEEALQKNKPGDLKETFNMGLDLNGNHPRVRAGTPLYGPNRYPEQPKAFKTVLEAHYARMLALSKRLLAAMATALELPLDFFDQCLTDPLCVLRLIHYPPDSERCADDQSGCGVHTDYGCITLLAQDAVGGLEVFSRDRRWLAVPPIPGSFVVNIGDMMARWTNRRWVSTPHRVTSPFDGRDRYSIPFFVDPSFDTEVRCLPSCQGPDNPPRYAPILSGDWLLSRFDATYDYRHEGA